MKFFLARLFHPETRRLRGNVVIPSVARAAEEMVLNAVEADASVVEADELVIIFFQSQFRSIYLRIDSNSFNKDRIRSFFVAHHSRSPCFSSWCFTTWCDRLTGGTDHCSCGRMCVGGSRQWSWDPSSGTLGSMDLC